MAVPKTKTSKSKTRSRSRSHKKQLVGTVPCPECSEPHTPHRVCKACGFYKGRQVLTISQDE